MFDSHCHIIDHRFPIVANEGYVPSNFTLADYLAQVKPLGVVTPRGSTGEVHPIVCVHQAVWLDVDNDGAAIRGA
jgi:hypothetical protein